MFSYLTFLPLLVSAVLSSGRGLEAREVLDPNTELADEAIESVEAADTPVRRRRLWRPKVGEKFQIVLSATVDLKQGPVLPQDVQIFDIDLFDTNKQTIENLQRMGKKVICYFSAGTSEDWRDDFKEFKAKDQGANLPLWPGEKWLDVRSRDVQNIMRKRIRFASEQGCDAIDPDNMDGYSNERGGGFAKQLSQRDAIRYTRILAREARRYRMAIGLKNAEEIVPRVARYVHFAVNEECGMEADDVCEGYKPLLTPRGLFSRGKPVFHIEYVVRKPAVAQQNSTVPGLQGPVAASISEISNVVFGNISSTALRKRLCLDKDRVIGPKLSTVIKELSLDGWVMQCDGRTAITRTTQTQRQKEQSQRQKGGQKGGAEPVQTVTRDIPDYLAILAEPNPPADLQAEAELEMELDEELADFVEPTGPKKGAAKDRRPSPKWLELNPGSSFSR